MAIVISGIGTAVPQHRITQDAAALGTVPFCCETSQQGRMLEGLFRRSGVDTRHSILLRKSTGPLDPMEACQEFYPPRSASSPHGPTTAERMNYFEQAAGSLAVPAAKQALERSGNSPRQVTHLITVTCSGFSAPGFDYTLIHDLPLNPTVSRTQVGFMGCHAALNALRVARAFVGADPQAVVLICCVELCTLHYQYGWDPEQIVAMSLFSDGAAACVVQGGGKDIQDEKDGSCLVNDDQLPQVTRQPHCFGKPETSPAFELSTGYQIIANGALIVPDSHDAMTWRMSDHGFRMTLSPRVPEILAQHLLPWLTEWLGNHGYRPADIAHWAVHPGGPRILQAFTDATRLDPQCVELSRDILRRFGNMSSPTLVFILEALHGQTRTGPTVALGFGPGLAVEALLLC